MDPPRWDGEDDPWNDGDMRRIVVLVLLAFVAFAPRAAGAAGTTVPPADDGSADTSAAVTTTTIDNSFLDTKRELTQCLNNSINLPDCGVEPKLAGDRGGPLQIVTFSLMGLGLVLIGWRVTRAIRARDHALGSTSAR